MGDDRLYLSRGERALSGSRPRRGRTLLLFLTVFGVCFLAALGGLLSVVGPERAEREDRPGPIETVIAAPAVPLAMNTTIDPVPEPAPGPPAPAPAAPAPAPAVAAAAAAPSRPEPGVAAAPAERPRPEPGTDLEALSRRLAAPPPAPEPEDAIVDEPRLAAAPGPRPGRAPPRPSFACAGRLSPTERMICAEPALAQADRRMEAALRRSLQLADNPDRLLREQNRWVRERERMGQDYVSVLDHYERRIDELWVGQ